MYQGKRLYNGERRTVHQGNVLVLLVISLILVGFVVIGNIFIMVGHDARDRVVQATVSEVPRAVGLIAQNSLDNPDVVQTFITHLLATNKSVLTLDVVQFADSNPYIIASTNADTHSTSTPVTEPILNSSLVAQATPGVVIIEDTGATILASYAFADGDGNVMGYVDAHFNSATIVAPIDRNLVRATRVLVVILLLTLLILFWFLGTRQYLRVWRHANRQVEVHDEAISNIVHELQTPITVLQGYIAMLSSEVAVFSKAQRYLERIEKTSNQIESFVDNIQMALLLERGYVQSNPERINPAIVVQDVIEGIAKKHYKPSVEIKHELVATAPIFIDRALFKKALTHIVKNALQYTDEGTVRVIIATEGGDVLIRVEDSGVGMSADQQERIFDKWYRAQHAMKDGVRGSGLGLWIAQTLITRMKGRIRVVSDVGIGTTVTIRFAMVA